MKVLLFLLILLLSAPILADEPLPLAKKKAEKTQIKGTIDGKHVNLKTRETSRYKITTGYIDGKYVRLKEKKKKD